MEALPSMEDSSHDQPVMNEAAAALMSFLSAHGSLVDKKKIDGQEGADTVFVWSPDEQRRQRCSSAVLYLRAADFCSSLLCWRHFQPADVARAWAGLGDVIIPKSMRRDGIDPVHLLQPWTSVIFATVKRSTPSQPCIFLRFRGHFEESK